MLFVVPEFHLADDSNAKMIRSLREEEDNGDPLEEWSNIDTEDTVQHFYYIFYQIDTCNKNNHTANLPTKSVSSV